MNIGLKDFFIEQTDSKMIGRIAMYAQNHYTIATQTGLVSGTITGKMQFDNQYPRIGDFVVYEPTKDGSLNVIKEILERQTCLSRKAAGTTNDEQVIAANMDYLFIVMSLNEDFNIRRLERYLVGAWESGAEPVVILTKVDLCEDYLDQMALVEAVTFGIKTFAISALKGMNMDLLEEFNQEGKTIALVGSSGVGKSTLINTLAGKEVMKTDGLRNDDKGHHTTTHREMIFTDKAILIDTPGMREFSSYTGEGLAHEFQDIIDLAKACKFADCRHDKEPGCSIQAALKSGELDKTRLRSYYNLLKEAKRQRLKAKRQERVQAQKIEKAKRQSKPRTKKWDAANY